MEYEHYVKCAEYIKSAAPFEPKIGLILGSGLGPIAENIENPVKIAYGDIPGFLRSTAPDHAGELIFGLLGGKKVVCMSGRFHYYEGYDFEQLSLPIRVLKLLGIRAVILTNAAGGVNTDYRVGDIMVISDHVKFAPGSPLRGKNIDEFGPRFFDTSDMYTKKLREKALSLQEGSGLTFHEGTYFYMAGPQFETPAEIRAIRILGGDAVGMSTVTEALTAAHCGLPLLAFSVVTNMAAGVLDQPLTCEEVNETGRIVSARFSRYMIKLIENM